jgi:hypothetical protein
MSDSRVRRSPRKIVWQIGLLALALSISTVFLIHHYGATRPTAMSSGREHAVKIHDQVVYLTTGEYAVALASHGLTILSIGAFLGLLLKSRTKKV